MQQFNYKKIESIIGYEFNNKKLLKQAFFRSSFAHENNEESNEVLEFIGDKVLDLAVIRILLEKYSKIDEKDEYFVSMKQEGFLTRVKSALVSTAYLAGSLERLGLEQYLYFGKSDIFNNVGNRKSVKEDLLEAIIGAIALDCNWDMDLIVEIVRKLLLVDDFLKVNDITSNYVGKVQEYAAEFGFVEPEYTLKSVTGAGETSWLAVLRIKELNAITNGYGLTKKEAKQDAAVQMIPHLQKYKILKGKKLPEDTNEAIFAFINQKVQEGEIGKPKYAFEEEYDEDGNPIWTCGVKFGINGTYCYGSGSSKKNAQRAALIKAMRTVLKGIMKP